jgi:hypothetical protein
VVWLHDDRHTIVIHLDWLPLGRIELNTPEPLTLTHLAVEAAADTLGLEVAANPRQKLGPAVKYSRGAKVIDPPELVEEGDGGFRYVTLAVFRGDGRPREEFTDPNARAVRGREDTNRSVSAIREEEPPLPPQDDHEALLLFIRFVGPRVPEEATLEVDGRREPLKRFAREQWTRIRAELPLARGVANAMAAAVREGSAEAA